MGRDSHKHLLCPSLSLSVICVSGPHGPFSTNSCFSVPPVFPAKCWECLSFPWGAVECHSPSCFKMRCNLHKLLTSQMTSSATVHPGNQHPGQGIVYPTLEGSLVSFPCPLHLQRVTTSVTPVTWLSLTFLPIEAGPLQPSGAFQAEVVSGPTLSGRTMKREGAGEGQGRGERTTH